MSYMNLESFSRHHGVHVQQILPMLRLSGDEVVVLGGSVVQGHGTRNSDFDVFALVDDSKVDDVVAGFRNHHDKRANDILALGTTTVDFQVMSLQSLADVFRDVSAIDFEDPNQSLSFDRVSPHYDNETINEVVHRLRTGIPLQNASTYDELFALLDFDRYCRWQVRYHANIGDNVYEDIVGVLDVGDQWTAALLAHDLLIYGGMILCFLGGRSIDRKKWTFMTLHDCPPQLTPLHARLQDLIRADKTDAANVRACLQLFNDIAENDTLIKDW